MQCFISIGFFFILVVLRQGLKQSPRLASRLLCSLGLPWTPDPPSFTSQRLRVQRGPSCWVWGFKWEMSPVGSHTWVPSLWQGSQRWCNLLSEEVRLPGQAWNVHSPEKVRHPGHAWNVHSPLFLQLILSVFCMWLETRSLRFLQWLPAPTLPSRHGLFLWNCKPEQAFFHRLPLVAMSYRDDRKVTDRPGEDTVLSGAEFVRTLNGKKTFYFNLHHAQRPSSMNYRSTYERQKEKIPSNHGETPLSSWQWEQLNRWKMKDLSIKGRIDKLKSKN